MKRWWCLLFAATAFGALLVGSPGRAADKDKDKTDAKKDSKADDADLKQLQGRWEIVQTTTAPKSHPFPLAHPFSVNGDKLTFSISRRDAGAADREPVALPTTKKGKLATHFTIQLDPSQSPKGLDLIPEGDNAEPVKAIYELKGHSLRVGFGDGKERPKGFDSSTHVVTYLLRETSKAKAPKAPKTSS